MTLHNETITEPRIFRKEMFTGTTILDFNGAVGEARFEDCIFDAQGSSYAILVPRDRKPRATIIGDIHEHSSQVLGSSKVLVLGKWLKFAETFFTDATDGFFNQVGGIFTIFENCYFDLFADLPNHGDPIQSGGGDWLMVRGCYVKIRGTGANSCVFLESHAKLTGQPVRHVRLINNVFDGGGYGVWSIEDPNFPAGPNEDIVLKGNTFKNQVFGQVTWTEGSKPIIMP